MRIIIATNQGGLDDMVFPAFGRCPTYTIIDIENGEIKETKIEPNQAANMPGGAGIAAAQFVINLEIDAVIGGNFGPNALNVLKQAGIKIYTAFGMKVKDAVQQLIDGKLSEMATPSAGPGFGAGPGRGMGGGRGFGRGRQ